MKKAMLMASMWVALSVLWWLAQASPVQAQTCAELGENCLDPLTGPSAETFRALNPISQGPFAGQLSTPGGILSRILVFALPLAGLALFVMLVWAGFQIVTGATNKQSLTQGMQRATSAIVGFLLLFASYWMIQLVEFVFSIQIL